MLPPPPPARQWIADPGSIHAGSGADPGEARPARGRDSDPHAGSIWIGKVNGSH